MHYRALLLVALLPLAACGSCDGSLSGTLDPGADGGAVDVGADADASPDGPQADAGPDAAADTGPACPIEYACADDCCEAGELCIRDSCVVPGAACTHPSECADGEICEESLGQCIPNPAVDCQYVPTFDTFEPQVELAWTDDPDTTPAPTNNQIMMTPAVADLTEDGIPEVVFSTFVGSNYEATSVLRAFDGRTKEVLFDLVEAEKRVAGSAAVAIGDIDADGRNEIVGVRVEGRGLIAIDDHTTGWAVLWEASAGYDASWDGAALADLDADGSVEVIIGNHVYAGADGTLLCTAPLSSPRRTLGSIPVDLDGDGRLEVVTGTGAFHFQDDGEGGYDCPVYWTTSVGLGYPAIGDFGTFDGAEPLFGQLDGKPEVVQVASNSESSSQIALVNGQTGEAIWTTGFPTEGHPHFGAAQCAGSIGGGPPTVADFDGDGAPEAASAGACFYTVFETDGAVKWKHPSQDFSSRVTGSSVFDFEGDGKAEVVYADECFIRVYDGTGNGDGTTSELFKRAHTSGTTRELPVIVDVDADYHAEIVLISNNYSSSLTGNCRSNWPGFDELGGEERGILIIEDANNEWVTTRPIWNQYAYQVTNVCDGLDDALCPGTTNRAGAIPVGQLPNVAQPYLNNFRQNVQGAGLFDAPDLVVVDIRSACETAYLTLEVTVANEGARGVAAGTPVSVWVTLDGTETLVGTVPTTRDLPPGAREKLVIQWEEGADLFGQDFSARAVVDDDGEGAGIHNECVEDNNERSQALSCVCEDDDDCPTGYYCAAGSCLPDPI